MKCDRSYITQGDLKKEDHIVTRLKNSNGLNNIFWIPFSYSQLWFLFISNLKFRLSTIVIACFPFFFSVPGDTFHLRIQNKQKLAAKS